MLQVDESPVVLLVLGWGTNSLMADLLRELDHGLSALPRGSEVIFANTHTPGDSLDVVLKTVVLDGLRVSGDSKDVSSLGGEVTAVEDENVREARQSDSRHQRCGFTALEPLRPHNPAALWLLHNCTIRR
jgi:hypothetical protein